MENKEALKLLDILKRYIAYTPLRHGVFSLGWKDIELTSEETELLRRWLENESL